MFPTANEWISTKKTTRTKPTPLQIRNRLARRSASRREESLLPLVQSSTHFVVHGISNQLAAAYETPEERRRKKEIYLERMQLLNVELPRLMERIDFNRSKRILTAAKIIQQKLWQTLKILMRRSRGVRLLQSRRNANQLLQLLPCWIKGFRTRRLICTLHAILYRHRITEILCHWRSTQRQNRLAQRYNYAYVRKNVKVWQQKTTLNKWKEYHHKLQRLRSVLRNIALNNSNVRPALNTWRLYTQQRKELKRRIRRKMMGLKGAALHAWREITIFLNERRLSIYFKFSKRLRHRNILRPFITWVQYKNRALAAKTIQSRSRGRANRQLYATKKTAMLHEESVRADKERHYVMDSGNDSWKVSHLQRTEAKRVLRQHRHQRKVAQKSLRLLPLLSPRSKLLSPIFTTYDIDNRGTIRSVYLDQIKQELGLKSTSSGTADSAALAESSLNETKVKAMLMHTSFERSVVVKIRRVWRNLSGASLDAAAVQLLQNIHLDCTKQESRASFRLQQASHRPHLACTQCGCGFVLYRNLLRHQERCAALLLRGGEPHEEGCSSGGGANSLKILTLREKLTKISQQ